MAFLLPIGVAALAPLLAMLEEVTVIAILTVLQAQPVVLITAEEIFHQLEVIGDQPLTAV